jgi:phosphoserine phosphatase
MTSYPGEVTTEPPDDRQTVLIRVSGPDHPGITAGLMTVLSDSGAVVHDIEQIVIRGQLSLGVAVEVPEGRDLLKDVLFFGWDQGMDVDFDLVSSTPTPNTSGHVVTILGPDLTPSEIATATTAIADAGANIDRIVRLSRYPVMSYELLVRDGDDDKLRSNLLHAAAANPGVDIAIQREGLGRRAKRLVVLDVDSTLIQDEVIDLLAAEAGCLDEVQRITRDAMEGGIDFESSLRMRVRLLGGLDEAAIERAWNNLHLTPGARTFVRTLRRLGYTVAIVSGGFTAFTDRLSNELGIHHSHANELEIREGKLTGELVGQVVDRERKAELLRSIASDERVPLSQTVAVGDGANDLDMLSAAGLGIAFNAKPIVEEAADTALTVPYLDAILFVLGIRREDVEAADSLDAPD